MNDIATPQNFEARMKSRIKESIGDLITDEELGKLVDRGLEEVFFATRPNPRHSYGGRNEPPTLPPLLHEIVKDLLMESVRAAVQNYINIHPEEVCAAVESGLKEGAGTAILAAVSQFFGSRLMNLQTDITNTLMARR